MCFCRKIVTVDKLGSGITSPVAAAEKHQSVCLLHEHPKGNAGCEVAHVGGVYQAFRG